MLTPLKPSSLEVIPENIPHELIAQNHWVIWCREPSERGKKKLSQGVPLDEPQDWTKRPYSPNGSLASTTDSDTWSGFQSCLQKYEDDGGYDGIGFVLSKDDVHGDEFFSVDLDHCRDSLDQSIEPWAQQIIEQFDSYTEVSPSGDGIHIFGRGQLPEKGRKKGNIEVYDHARYMTVTGHVI